MIGSISIALNAAVKRHPMTGMIVRIWLRHGTGERMEAKIKRSLPPAPEPTKSPERCSPGTAVRLAQHKYDQVTRYIKYKRTGRKRV